jgi:hypothetical protein
VRASVFIILAAGNHHCVSLPDDALGIVFVLLAIRVRKLGEDAKWMPASPSGILVDWDLEAVEGGQCKEEGGGLELEEGEGEEYPPRAKVSGEL